MPSKVFILNSIGVILQYSLLGLLYYFLFKVIRLIYTDLNLSEHKKISVKNVQNKFDGSTEAKLLVVDSGHVNLAQTSFLLEGTVYLGRNANNGIVIDDSFISHEHASIHKNQQGYWLTDLHSTNKTYLNGQPIVEATLLRNGDLIKVGSVTFSFKG